MRLRQNPSTLTPSILPEGLWHKGDISPTLTGQHCSRSSPRGCETYPPGSWLSRLIFAKVYYTSLFPLHVSLFFSFLPSCVRSFVRSFYRPSLISFILSFFPSTLPFFLTSLFFFFFSSFFPSFLHYPSFLLISLRLCMALTWCVHSSFG